MRQQYEEAIDIVKRMEPKGPALDMLLRVTVREVDDFDEAHQKFSAALRAEKERRRAELRKLVTLRSAMRKTEREYSDTYKIIEALRPKEFHRVTRTYKLVEAMQRRVRHG